MSCHGIWIVHVAGQSKGSICHEERVFWSVRERFYLTNDHGRCHRSVRENGKQLRRKDAGWWTSRKGKAGSCPIEFGIVGFQPVGS